MQCDVAITELLLRTVQHSPDARGFHFEGVANFFVGQASGAQDQKLRLCWFEEREHLPDSSTPLLAQQFVEWSVLDILLCDPAGGLLVLTAPARHAQSIDAQVRRCTVEPTTNVAISLQCGLAVQAPKSIVSHFIRVRTIAEEAHQDVDDSGIVLPKDCPKISFVPMLRRTLPQDHGATQCLCSFHDSASLLDSHT